MENHPENVASTQQPMRYRIFKALHEDSDKGWIWLSEPEINTRKIVRIENRETRRCIYCQYRHIDDDFVDIYNKRRTTKIVPELRGKALIISKWYRYALEI